MSDAPLQSSGEITPATPPKPGRHRYRPGETEDRYRAAHLIEKAMPR